MCLVYFILIKETLYLINFRRIFYIKKVLFPINYVDPTEIAVPVKQRRQRKIIMFSNAMLLKSEK